MSTHSEEVHLGFRDVRVFFDESDVEFGEPDRILGAWYPSHHLVEYMAYVWPWLDYEYIGDPPERTGFDECETHDIEVKLNDIGKGFLCVEDYYARC